MKRRRRQIVLRLQGIASPVLSNPLRSLVLTLLSSALVYWVAVTTLPYALAERHTALALRLNPDNPSALLVRARQVRSDLQSLTYDNQTNERATAGVGRLAAPEMSPVKDRAAEQTRLRAELHSLATRLIRVRPLDSTAFYFLGELAHDRNDARRFMKAAAARSRRETRAVFWLMADHYLNKDYAAALETADLLLRTSSGLGPLVMTYLAQLAEIEEARPLLAARLAAQPPWRKSFFESLPRLATNTSTPLVLIWDLADKQNGVTTAELRPYLENLIQLGLVEQAYSTWLQFLPAERLASQAWINNANFEQAPSGLPFDWRIASGLNATAELADTGDPKHLRALRISFSAGRARFPETSQVISAPPGAYRLSGLVRGEIEAKRGLRWTISCQSRTSAPLAATDMILGRMPVWQPFEVRFEVPQDDSCKGQRLQLIHDARSASEQIISGEVWFDSLLLERSP